MEKRFDGVSNFKDLRHHRTLTFGLRNGLRLQIRVHESSTIGGQLTCNHGKFLDALGAEFGDDSFQSRNVSIPLIFVVEVFGRAHLYKDFVV